MNMRTRTDVLLLVAFCGFLFFYGLGSFGLVGADEPRYAQVAREMLDRHDWVTPTLQGKPWLEKPVLYYWQAILSYKFFGVSDRAARIPAAFDASLLIAAIYLFLRRLRPGSEIDGALITAGCAGLIGFARGASTDMPLAAMFAIAMLAWYAWYEGKSRIALAAFYFFLALATLAKGPVAIFLAGIILFVFIAARRDWRAISGTLWAPGVALFLAVALPWYIAVQVRNPEFFRVFIVEHNLGRFGQDLYHHRQPFWFYLPVLVLALLPWTLWLVLAIIERIRLLWNERRDAVATYEDAWQLLLLIWLLVPVLFFSASQSKLPGYILPAIPAGGLLIAEYLRTHRSEEAKVSLWCVVTHAVLCGVLVCAALTAPTLQMHHHLASGTWSYVAAGAAVLVAIAIGVALARVGLRVLRAATLVSVVIAVAAILRLASPVIDATKSARPIAQDILSFSHESVPVAACRINRQQEYGLEFYLNRPVQRYENGEVPDAPHVLVIGENASLQLSEYVLGRHVSHLTDVPAQRLRVYWVGGK
ncbi:MAG TPA: glycosyltransferase family 39 protein [Terriglobales bacterium]|nr:glycosyltransferase family 39 protein [Terriglobales bacterium]